MPRFVVISDTHGHHRQLALPEGDVLIHAGDVCDRGNQSEVNDFFQWFDDQDFAHKVLIWGNHDFDLNTNQCLFPEHPPSGIHYLDSCGLTVDRVQIWGVPTPASKKDEPWSSIPDTVDVLVTHRPPFKILDVSRLKGHQGSRKLQHEIGRIQPRIHVFGHIHRSYGVTQGPNGWSVNASLYRSSEKRLVHAPVSFTISESEMSQPPSPAQH